MRRRYARHGADIFDSHQLMEMLLFHSIRRGDTNGLAHKVLNTCTEGGLTRAMSSALLQVDGIGEKTATLLSLSSDVTVRLLQDSLKNEPFKTDFSLRLYTWLCFASCREKAVFALLLDDRKRLLDKVCIARGKAARPESYLESVLQAAPSLEGASKNCRYVVLAHNHRSGATVPSVEDVYLTELFSEGLSNSGMSLLASFVVTDTDCIRCDTTINDEQEIK